LINKVERHAARFIVNSIDFGREVSSHYIWTRFAWSIGRSMNVQSASVPKFFRCALFNCDYTQAIEMGRLAGIPAAREVKGFSFHAPFPTAMSVRAAWGKCGS
jgi:hypothetical protein